MRVETNAETQTARIVYEDGIVVTLPYGDVLLFDFYPVPVAFAVEQEQRRADDEPAHRR